MLSPLRISTSNGISPPNDITIYNYTIKKFKFKPKRYLHISTSYEHIEMLIKMIENDASTFMELVNGSAIDYFDNIKLRQNSLFNIVRI